MTWKIENIGKAIFALLTESETGYGQIDEFVYESSAVLISIAIIAVLLTLILNPGLRQRRRIEDRYMFREFILVLLHLIVDLILSFPESFGDRAADIIYHAGPTLAEFLYMLAILQWMVFVDYSLYRSEDHIKRRYKHAVLPILVIMGAEAVQDFLAFVVGGTDASIISMDILQIIKLIVELGYIIKAVQLVKAYERESREPRFLSLSVFIIPFILGSLFRFYDAAFMALGVILTYGAVRKRDRFLDHETGFYNREFLEYRGQYRDKMDFTGGNGILIDAKGNGKAMAELLKELKPADINVFSLGEDRFLLITEALRDSAAKMAMMTIKEAAEGLDPPFTPGIKSVKRGNDESAETFADRLLSESA